MALELLGLDQIDPMGIKKHVINPFLEKMGISVEITFQIVNKSRSRLFDITYSVDGATFNTQKGRETFLGFFNPTSAFQHLSLRPTNGVIAVKFVMLDPEHQKQSSKIHLHIKSQWQYEMVDREDTLELSFTGYKKVKIIKHGSKFIYDFVSEKKNLYVLSVKNTEDQSLAHEAGVFCDAGEVEYLAEPKGLEQAVTNFLAAKDKIRKVDMEAVGFMLEVRIQNFTRKSLTELATKLMKNHIDELNSCSHFHQSSKDCEKKLADSLLKLHKVLEDAKNKGEPKDSYFCQGYTFAKQAFDSRTTANNALEEFKKCKKNQVTCVDSDFEYFLQAEGHAKDAMDKFGNAIWNLREIPKIWPGIELQSADDLYTSKLRWTEAQMEDYKEKIAKCAPKKQIGISHS